MEWENQDDGFIAKILKPDGEGSIRAPQPGVVLWMHDMFKHRQGDCRGGSNC